MVLVAKSLAEAGIGTQLVGIGSASANRPEAFNVRLAGVFESLKCLGVVLTLMISQIGAWRLLRWILDLLALSLFVVCLVPVFVISLLIYKLCPSYVRRAFPGLRRLSLWARWPLMPFIYGLLFLRVFATFYRELKAVDAFDVIHCNDLETLLIGVYYKNRHGKKLVYDAHEYFPQQASWFKGSLEKILARYEKYLIASVDEIFTVSAPIGEVMENKYQLKNKVHIVPNVFSKALAVPAIPVVTAGRPVHFHYMGGFLAERGITFLIENWKDIDPRQATLHLRGPSSSHHAECLELAKKLNLLDRSVFFEPPVKEDALISIAKDFDVGLIPYLPVSLNNEFCCPNKLSQYMLAGNAILTQKLPNVVQFVEKYKNGAVYDFKDPQSFKRAVEKLLDPNLISEMRANSLSAAKTDYNWEVQGQSFLAVYRSF